MYVTIGQRALPTKFIELHNSIPIQSVVPKISKTTLAMILIKYRNSDCDAKISSSFRIPKSFFVPQNDVFILDCCFRDSISC